MIPGVTVRRRGDAGETLIEILMSIAIMGVVLVGLIAGLTTAMLGADVHRHLTDVEIVARQYGEALVTKAYDPPSTTLNADATSTSLTVSSVPAGLPATPFYVAVDGEVLQVKNMSGAGNKTWQLQDPPQDSHLSGAAVIYDAMYDACVAPAHLAPTYTVPATAKYVQMPTIVTLEFFAPTGATIADCTTWPTTTALPCSTFAAGGGGKKEQLTDCDPALLRVTIKTQTSTSAPRKADTTTRVLIRRNDA